MKEVFLPCYKRGFALSNYYSRSLGFDFISHMVRLTKDDRHFENHPNHARIIEGWVKWLFASLSGTGLRFDYVANVIGHDEMIGNPQKPLSLITQGLAPHLHAAYRCDLLIKTRITARQRGSDAFPDAARREANVKGAFAVTPAYRLITNSKILIVDDVITTGATLKDIGRALTKGNSSNTLYFITLGHANRSANSNMDEVLDRYFGGLNFDRFAFDATVSPGSPVTKVN